MFGWMLRRVTEKIIIRKEQGSSLKNYCKIFGDRIVKLILWVVYAVYSGRILKSMPKRSDTL